MKLLIITASLLLCAFTAYPTYVAVKVLYVINPNTLIIENLYTKQRQTFIIAGTYTSDNKSINFQAIQYIKKFCLYGRDEFIGAEIYDTDQYGHTIGDLKHLDRIQQLSNLLIVQGYVYCSPDNKSGLQYQEWAQLHHSGIWR